MERFQGSRHRVVKASKHGVSHLEVKKQRDRFISVVRECFEGVDGINSAMIDAQQREMLSLNETMDDVRRRNEDLEKELQRAAEEKEGEVAAIRNEKDMAVAELKKERGTRKSYAYIISELQQAAQKNERDLVNLRAQDKEPSAEAKGKEGETIMLRVDSERSEAVLRAALNSTPSELDKKIIDCARKVYVIQEEVNAHRANLARSRDKSQSVSVEEAKSLRWRCEVFGMALKVNTRKLERARAKLAATALRRATTLGDGGSVMKS